MGKMQTSRAEFRQMANFVLKLIASVCVSAGWSPMMMSEYRRDLAGTICINIASVLRFHWVGGEAVDSSTGLGLGSGS